MTTLEDRLRNFSFPDGELDSDVRRTYVALRLWLGGIGFFLPIILVSLGPLCAVGIALIIYKGYGRLENLLLNAAGGALIVVALEPMPWTTTGNDTGTFSVHGAAAVIFFMLIAATIWFCAGDTLLKGIDDRVRLRWLRTYRIFAIAMVVAPLIAFAISRQGQWRIWVEAFGIWVFSTYWFAKTYELSKVSEVEPTDKPDPKLKRVGGELRIG